MVESFTITTDNDVNPSHGQLYNDHTDVRGSGGLCMTLFRKMSNYFYYLLIIFFYFFSSRSYSKR